jgi:hypothetical protein
MYNIVERPSGFHIMCDCTNGCKKCSREFGGSAVPDEVNVAMNEMKKTLLDIQHIASSGGNIEQISLLAAGALSYYDAASTRLRNPPKYKLVRIEE